MAFYAGDVQGSSGQTLTIPITARTEGSYPLRVLMFNLTVEPLYGSPPITNAVQFTPRFGPGLAGSLESSGTPNNYGAAWLNNATIRSFHQRHARHANGDFARRRRPLASYAVSFDHASGSPNGLVFIPGDGQYRRYYAVGPVRIAL